MRRFQEYRDALRRVVLDLAPRPASGELPSGIESALIFTRPPKPELGDLALAAFPLAKFVGRPPNSLAKEWVEAIAAELARKDSLLSKLEVPVVKAEPQGPYVNLTLDPAALAALVLQCVVEGAGAYGRALVPTGQSVMVEYSSPNTNKPLHLGHVRNNLIGMSLSNILEAAGDTVIRTSLINDRGIHICKSMLSYQLWGGGETPAGTGEKGDHFVGRYYVLFSVRLQEERQAYATAHGVDLTLYSKEAFRALTDKEEIRRRQEESERFEAEFAAASALNRQATDLLRRWESGDEEVLTLWRTMNEWVYAGFRQTYERLGCTFDRWYFESQVWQLGKKEVERGLASGLFRKDPDGSVWAVLEPLGLKDKILLRSDGTSVYITQDLGTAIRKFEDYGMDRSVYVVAAEQDDHFKNLFAILKQLGHPWADRCYHASYNMVNLPHGRGKLKSREGTSADADDLLDELKQLARQKIQEGGFCEDATLAEEISEWIGQGAMKLFILQVSPEKVITFDPSETLAFTGDTGPAVQYSHARIHGILRKALATGKVVAEDLLPGGHFLRPERVSAPLLVEAEEREVLRYLADFPDVLSTARRLLSSAPLATCLLDLTKAYARMYHQHEVLQAATPELMRARLQLALSVAQVLRNGLNLLTIEAPERM